MKLTKTDEQNEESLYREVSEDGKVELVVAPVIYGYRVRAGLVGSMAYHVDYCAGAEQENVELLFMAVKAIMEMYPTEKFNLISWPYQERKPVFNDAKCWLSLVAWAGESGKLQEAELPTLSLLRAEFFAKHWK